MVVRWGVLSTASIGEKQLIPAIQNAAGAELRAVASRDEGKARAFAKRLHISKAYGSYEALLQDADIDAVYIPLPNHLHAAWTIKAFEHGKHVLCEKPAALHADQLRKMWTVCKQHGVIFAEAFMYPHHAIWQRVRDLVATGEIGRVQIVNACFSFPLDNVHDIRWNPAMGGGSLYDVGCYCVHVIRTLARGATLTDVLATARFAEDGVVDRSLAAVLQFSNGMMAHFDSSFEVVDRQQVEIVGSTGTITVPYAFRPDVGEPILVVKGSGGERTELLEHTPMYQRQVEAFSMAIKQGAMPMNSWEDSLSNMKIIDAIYAAAGRKPFIGET